MFGKILKGVGKVFGAASSVLGSPLGGLATSALGSLWEDKQSRKAVDKNLAFQAEMSNTAYQRSMKDMEAAGLNPILAYKQGGASTPTGAMYNPPNPGSSAMSGFLRSQQARNLVEQNENIQANSALQLQQTRRLRLENDAYDRLSPTERLIFLGANPVAAGAAAARNILPLAGGSAKALKKAHDVTSKLSPIGNFMRKVRK